MTKMNNPLAFSQLRPCLKEIVYVKKNPDRSLTTANVQTTPSCKCGAYTKSQALTGVLWVFTSQHVSLTDRVYCCATGVREDIDWS